MEETDALPHKHQKGEVSAAHDKTPQAHEPALLGGRAIAPVAPVAYNPEGNAIPHGDWRVWELLYLSMNEKRRIFACVKYLATS